MNIYGQQEAERVGSGAKVGKLRAVLALCSRKLRRGLQVRLLEAFILPVKLMSALLTGMCMLHKLCTPTRVEAPKAERSHGDT